MPLFLLLLNLIIGTGAINQNSAIKSTYPISNASEVNPDVQLQITFAQPPKLGTSGMIRIFDADSDELIDSLDMSIAPGPRNTRTPSPYDTLIYRGIPDKTYTVYEPDTDPSHVYQLKYVGGSSSMDALHFYPLLFNDNTATITLHTGKLTYGKTYYVQIDKEVFPLNNGQFEGITDKSWVFSTKQAAPPSDASTYTVASDGTGDFNTVQAAIDFIPNSNSTPRTIFVKNGTYQEIVYFSGKQNITIQGESRDGTVFQYATNGVFNKRRYLFASNACKDITITNLTLISLGESPAQAEGLLTKGDRIKVLNVTIIGSGDALQSAGSVYLSHTSIKGFGDNVLGAGANFFYKCDFISTYGPHLWPRNGADSHGDVLVNCRLWTEGSVTTDIARSPDSGGKSWPYAEAVLINCELEGLRSRGWGDAAPDNENVRFWEYNSINLEDWLPADITDRSSYSKQLTWQADSTTILNYCDPQYVLDGWQPEYQPKLWPDQDTLSFVLGERGEISVRLAAAPIPSYQWYKDGKLLSGETNSSIKIDSITNVHEGQYSVKIWNHIGSDSTYVTQVVTTQPTEPEEILGTEIDPGDTIRLYPNATKNTLKIQYLVDIPGKIEGHLLNISGKKVLDFEDQNVNKGQISSLNVSLLRSGNYIVEIIHSGQKTQRRIVITK